MSKKKTDNRNTMKSATWIAVALFVVGLAVLAGIYMEKNTTISAVEFSGNFFTDEELLLESIESPVGLYADSVNYNVLFESIRQLPYVEDVSVSMGMRGTLSFTIQEREPLALLVEGSRRIYIAEDGVKLPLLPGRAQDVPLLYGFKVNPVADTLSGEAFSQVSEFLAEAKKNEFSWITISEVGWNEREGVIVLTHENGVKLLFGHHDFSDKIAQWEVFYTEVISRKGISSFESIDLRFRDQIVTHEL